MQRLIVIAAAAAILSATPGKSSGANGPPVMPYVFEMNCFSCHQERIKSGPTGILDMKTKAGNPLHEEFIRSNARFGINAMPAFRPSEVSAKDLDAIVAYLKELAAYRKTHPGFKPVPAREGVAKK